MKYSQLEAVIILIFIFAPINLKAQDDAKIEKVLLKHFQKGNYEKCENQAKKFRKKQPASIIPYYYLCKVELQKSYLIQPSPDKKQWRHLKSATNYTRKINTKGDPLIQEVQQSVIGYIDSWNDTSFTSTHVKSVLKAYTKSFKDTLDIYWEYYPRPIFSEVEPPVTYSIPKADSLRTELLKFASQWVGVPYLYAGENPKTGFDCSGFVLYVYKHIGVELPHSAQMQSELDGKILTIEDALPGDLIFFGRRNGDKWRTQHAGIYYGNENGEPKVIHCVSRGVSIDGDNSSWDHYWKDLILFVKRLPELD